MEELKQEMLTQNNRSTSDPIFIVVEKKKIYGVDSNFSCDGRERQDTDLIDPKENLCTVCYKQYAETGEIPEECDDGDCEETFVNYRIEEDVPNLRAAFSSQGRHVTSISPRTDTTTTRQHTAMRLVRTTTTN